jgi:hypothetical protein
MGNRVISKVSYLTHTGVYAWFSYLLYQHNELFAFGVGIGLTALGLIIAVFNED